MSSADDYRIELSDDREADIDAAVEVLRIRDEAKRRLYLEQYGTPAKLMDILTSTTELANQEPPEVIVEDLLKQGSLAMLAGAAKTGKTFIAIDIACHVAMGKAWCGKKVQRTPVLYIALEGAGGFRDRMAAWYQVYNDGQRIPDEWFTLISGHMVNIMLPETVEQLREVIEAKDIGLVILDTWSRSIPGVNENDNTEQLLAISNMQQVIDDTGVTVLAIHHFGRNDQVRGASALEGNFDTVLTVNKLDEKRLEAALSGSTQDMKKHGKVVDLIAKFQKDLPDGLIHTTKLRPIWLREHRGRPDTLIPMPSEEVLMTAKDGEVYWAPPEAATAAYDPKDPSDRMLQYLSENGPTTFTKLREAVGGNKKILMAARDELLETQRIKITDEGKLEWSDN